MYLLGYDIGSSSIKAALVDSSTGKTIGIAQYPESEMDIISRQQGWAEQQPELWWENVGHATKKLLAESGTKPGDIQGIGISYQMHGLVLVDKDQHVLRPSIIWCDSRAVEVGNMAFKDLGEEKCLRHLLNSPGNFTASKLKWVKDNEPNLYEKIDKAMLPGDYIAMKMTGEINTTISGLSEGMFWDFENKDVARFLMENYGISENLIPEIVPTFSNQGTLTVEAAAFLGLKSGIPIGYRAGDQPNNAMSLNVLNPGEVAATGGTSGVVYGVVDQPVIDPQTRVNSFAHVNYTKEESRIGVLLCVNGAGIQYSWIRQMLASDNLSYTDMERMVSSVAVNSDGLRIIPFGNGAERMLQNKDVGGHMVNIQFNRHSKAHFYRAALEGIAYSFIYGVEVMQGMGLNTNVMRVGNDNLFQSKAFSTTIASILDCEIEMIETTGAVGAAKAAGLATGIYASATEAFTDVKVIETYHAEGQKETYRNGYETWKNDLKRILA